MSLGLFTAVKAGSYISDAIQATTPLLYLASFVGPILIVAAIFWMIGRRF